MRGIAFVLVLICVSVALAQTPDANPTLYYIVTDPVDIQAKADAAAPVLDRAEPLTYIAVHKRLPGGWFKLKMRKPGASPLDLILDYDKATMDAFVKPSSDDNYIVAEKMDAVRIGKINGRTWPVAVKNEAAKCLFKIFSITKKQKQA